jgi:hypothetical protein
MALALAGKRRQQPRREGPEMAFLAAGVYAAMFGNKTAEAATESRFR